MEQNISEVIESKIDCYKSMFEHTVHGVVTYKGYNVILIDNYSRDYPGNKYGTKDKNIHTIMNNEVPKEFRFNKSIRKTRTYIEKDIPIDDICGRKFIYVYKCDTM